MPRLYLVRHGKTVANHPDPGLSELGFAQANVLAERLAPRGPLPILTSPFRRTRETSIPLAQRWSVTPQTDARIGEVPLPPEAGFRNHAEWLKFDGNQRWSEMHDPLRTWRGELLQMLIEIRGDTVVVSHFVAINVAVGRARGDDRVTCFQPDNCSCTIVESDGKSLQLVELGAEGEVVLAR